MSMLDESLGKEDALLLNNKGDFALVIFLPFMLTLIYTQKKTTYVSFKDSTLGCSQICSANIQADTLTMHTPAGMLSLQSLLELIGLKNLNALLSEREKLYRLTKSTELTTNLHCLWRRPTLQHHSFHF